MTPAEIVADTNVIACCYEGAFLKPIFAIRHLPNPGDDEGTKDSTTTNLIPQVIALINIYNNDQSGNMVDAIETEHRRILFSLYPGLTKRNNGREDDIVNRLVFMLDMPIGVSEVSMRQIMHLLERFFIMMVGPVHLMTKHQLTIAYRDLVQATFEPIVLRLVEMALTVESVRLQCPTTLKHGMAVDNTQDRSPLNQVGAIVQNTIDLSHVIYINESQFPLEDTSCVVLQQNNILYGSRKIDNTALIIFSAFSGLKRDPGSSSVTLTHLIWTDGRQDRLLPHLAHIHVQGDGADNVVCAWMTIVSAATTPSPMSARAFRDALRSEYHSHMATLTQTLMDRVSPQIDFAACYIPTAAMRHWYYLLPQLPGLAHFVLANRTDEWVHAPGIAPLPLVPVTVTDTRPTDAAMIEMIRHKVWETMDFGQEGLALGYTHAIRQEGAIQHYYRLFTVSKTLCEATLEAHMKESRRKRDKRRRPPPMAELNDVELAPNQMSSVIRADADGGSTLPRPIDKKGPTGSVGYYTELASRARRPGEVLCEVYALFSGPMSIPTMDMVVRRVVLMAMTGTLNQALE